MLYDWTTRYVQTGKRSLPGLPDDVLSGVTDKREGKKRLERVREILLAK
jgi:hypothetical protein